MKSLLPWAGSAGVMLLLTSCSLLQSAVVGTVKVSAFAVKKTAAVAATTGKVAVKSTVSAGKFVGRRVGDAADGSDDDRRRERSEDEREREAGQDEGSRSAR